MFNTKKLKYYYSYQSIIIIIQIIISVSILSFLNHSILWYLSLILLLYCVYYIKRPITKIETFIIMNKIYMVACVIIGLALGKLIKIPSSLLGIIIGVAISDVLSFTKSRIGEKTTNSIVSRKTSLLEKLLIYVNIKEYSNLLPILGVGDIIFFSLLVSSLYQINPDYLLQSVALLILGVIINYICIYFSCKRKGYKGFPGTLGPSITFMIFIFICI